MLTVGQLAKATNTTSVTIRYYEKQGLIPKAKRGEGGYRFYPETLVAQIFFIRNAQNVGFSLEEIKELLSLQLKKGVSSNIVKELTLSKINEISMKINKLEQIQEILSAWANTCDGKSPIHQCPILEKLYHPIGLKDMK